MSGALLFVVALAGAATMTIELSAVRLLAPWFGSSNAVWTNVIGVILLALALGYAVGARWSRARTSPGRRVGLVLLAAAALVVWQPFLAGPVAERLMPAGVALDQSADLLVWGSLAAAVLLFMPAAAVLGCVGPLAAESLERDTGRSAGEAGGRVLAASTLGSLIGTFGTTHVFLPRFGLDATFLGASGLLGVAGAFQLLRLGRRSLTEAAAPVLLALVLAGGLAASRRATPETAPGDRLLASVTSAYQELRVVEREVNGAAWRFLEVNEGFDSFQSVWAPQTGLMGGGFYYDHFALPAAFGATSDRWRVLVLGLGAGTAFRVLEGALPDGVQLEATGVELDAAVVALGERWFDLDEGRPGRLVLAGVDARWALRQCTGPFDQIIVDAFANNMEVPPHLASLEFFREVRAKLADGGWLTVYCAGFGFEDPVISALASTAARAFEGDALLARIPRSRNCSLHVRRDAPVPTPGSIHWKARGPAASLLAPLELSGATRLIQRNDAATVLTDDRSDILALQLASIRSGRRRWYEGMQ